MRLLTRLALGLLGLAASGVAEDPSTESAIELQPTSFRNFIKENDVVMAEFYAVSAPAARSPIGALMLPSRNNC